jgi:hypothetical protein
MRRKKWTCKSINSLEGRSHPSCALAVRRTSCAWDQHHPVRLGHVRDRLLGPEAGDRAAWYRHPGRYAGLASGRSAAQIADPLVERGPEVVGPAGRLENRHAALDARQKGGGPVLDVQIGR